MNKQEQPFRLALIGAGAVTASLHLPGALASDRVVVKAVVDTVVDRAQQLCWEYGISPIVTSRFEDILSEVDGVVIATPNHTHSAIAIPCLRAGIPCLVEKPLATRVADAQAMCDEADRANVVLAVGYSTRFRDEVVLLHELLSSHYFGRVRRFHYQEGSVGGWSPLSGYITDLDASGGGVLTVVGTHFLDRMLYWFGYPDWCKLEDDANGGPEAHCLASFRYDRSDGPIDGTLLLSKTVSLKPGLVIEAERGDVIFPMGRSPIYFRPTERTDLQMTITPTGHRVFSPAKQDAQLEIENFVQACRSRAQPMVSGKSGMQSIKLLEELYRKRTKIKEPWSASSPGQAA